MVATGRHFKNDAAIEVAVYLKEFDAGQPNTSLVSEGEFGALKIRNFFPGSGCGFILKAGRIQRMNPGLQNFKGRRAIITGNISCELLVVWKNNPIPLSPEFVESLIAVLGNLSTVLK